MSVTFQVYRASTEGQIIADETTRKLQDDEVYIETTHSGICGTDEHFLKSGQVLGHEGVGIVRQIGPKVTSVKVGDRVGFAYVRKVCGNCDNCLTGLDQYCRAARIYGECDFDIGSFSTGTVWDASCIFPIPDGYRSEDAAPMMCAGATVWHCLHQFNVRPSDRVGIMGVGGLGHMAIKIAAAMGCHVVAFSGSESKREDAMEFGASEFHLFNASGESRDVRPLKHLLLCGSGPVDYSNLIPLMDTDGAIYPLTVTLEPTLIPLLAMNQRGVRIQGSTVTSRRNLQVLLDFVSRQKIIPTIIKYPLTKQGIETAMEELRDGRVRYRAVLERPEDRK